jgi:hypothetical protein
MAMGEALHETIDYGVNASTAQKDERAWLFWETVCESQGTSPLRTAEDVRQHPEKQSHLLSVLLLYAFAICVPKDRSRHFVKPRSALAYPLGVRHDGAKSSSWSPCVLLVLRPLFFRMIQH